MKDSIGLPAESISGGLKSDILIEDKLIPLNYNITAIRHLRYLPLCLHSYDFFEINCVLSGSCTYQTPGKKDLDTWLFEGSIRDNPAYGRDRPTEDEIVSAAKSACTDSFSRTLPNDYDMQLEHSAENISQWERQLLTIARAICFKAANSDL